jgi:uncharacterized protein YjiS (DUF1127 family)
MSDRMVTNETAQIVRLREWQPVRRRRARVFSWQAVAAAWRRHRSRQRISELDGHMLKDIGVSFAEAEAEANKPFWRA